MANVLIVVYLLIVLALIGVILLQRSEGGGLGMGGGNSNGLMSVRGSANLLTRTTAVLATLFFATAIGLTILSDIDNNNRGILQQAADGAGSEISAPTSVLDALNALEGDDSLTVPAAPVTEEAPPATDAAAPAATEAAPAAPTTDPALSVPAAEPAPDAGETPAAPVN